MKSLIISILFCLSFSTFAHAQDIDPRWKVKSVPNLMLTEPPSHEKIDQDVTAALETQVTGTTDKNYLLVVTMQPLKQDNNHPGFSAGPCVSSYNLVVDLATARSYSLDTLLDMGVCARYTIAFY